ncbi:hypothetical protein GGX14DRAFT_627525 [Mycena pura]|uniref:Uncharacterized protein n=1 Tax=Mycena pura TaxID=153505 RepID=A0AAD6YR32_9AGAR|nr:hypothetical protein GGX14DRAFT_627525 [Mycena pura]
MEEDDGVELELRHRSRTTLAYALCEQLRLILELALATWLKGDYRTGKRLNMKKIISYIASDYTKDKIWLRRIRPTQREYQVLISLDDSSRLAESHSVYLTFVTLALVSKALGRLVAGDVAITKFGEDVDPAWAGTKLMGAFRLDQKKTSVLSVVEASLRVLEAARERRVMGSASAADLWQLEIIISDGIADELHSAAAPSTGAGRKPAVQGSVLTMDTAEYKNVDGRMEVRLQRYLDSFPFEYFIIVLAGTLRQFFERISED